MDNLINKNVVNLINRAQNKQSCWSIITSQNYIK